MDYEKLKSDFPEMFKDNYGLSFGEGWLPALHSTCQRIMSYCKDNNKPIPEINYIKEKYGIIDVFATDTDEYIDNILFELEDSTETICEVCGAPGTITEPPKWLKVRCLEHKNI